MAEQAPASAPDRRPRWWRRHRRDLVFVALIVVGMHWLQTRHIPSGEAPAFIAPHAGGGELSLQQWRRHHQDSPVAVYFWAEWCPVCRAQQPNIDAVREHWPVLTVAMQSGDAAAVARLQQERGLEWTTVADDDGRIAASYGVHGVPAFIVFDGAGNIRAASVGYTTSWAMRLRLWWAGLFT